MRVALPLLSAGVPAATVAATSKVVDDNMHYSPALAAYGVPPAWQQPVTELLFQRLREWGHGLTDSSPTAHSASAPEKSASRHRR